MTHDRLLELLRYDPDTGVFTWREDMPVRRGKRMNGLVAGSPSIEGYINIDIDRVKYRAGRLAFFYMTGEWPTQFVDHINRDRRDNRWCNLRDVSKSVNRINYVRDGYPPPPDLSSEFPMAFA